MLLQDVSAINQTLVERRQKYAKLPGSDRRRNLLCCAWPTAVMSATTTLYLKEYTTDYLLF